MKRAIVSVVCLVLVLFNQTATAVDATAAWNQCCTQYHFAGYPQASTTTFEQAYSGDDFESDFAAIKAAVASQVMGTGGGLEGDDLLNDSLRNWN